MPMSDQVDWKKLFPQEQQVPAGNPIADYYANRSDSQAGAADALGTVTGLGILPSILAWVTDGPLDAAFLTAMTGGAGYGAKRFSDGAYQDRQASNMWANRFGSGNPNQGLPGTPAGPAWRK